MGDLIGPGASSEKLPDPVIFKTEKISRLRSDRIKPERALPVYKDGRIYIASSRKKLVAFDLSGERVLEHELSWAPVSTPLIEDNRVYVAGSDGGFHCLELASGKELWTRDLKLMDFSRPAASGNAIIFQTGRDRVVALSRDEGEWLWEHQHLRPEDLALKGLCPPAIKDGIVYIGLSAGSVAAMDAETGKLLWKRLPFKKTKFRDVDAPLRVNDSAVYAVSVSGKTAALSRKTGRTYWKFERGGMAGSVLEGGTLYLATDRAEIMAVDKMTGKKQWTTELSKRKKKKFFDLPTTPIIRGDFLVTVSRGGRVFMLDKRTGEIERHYFYYTDTSAPAVEVGDTGFLIMDNKGIIRYWSLAGTRG
ncbi:MAG: PQQ-binding-like beta-propeller repeat protein [bacterium]